jgi:hypothetical protein
MHEAWRLLHPLERVVARLRRRRPLPPPDYILHMDAQQDVFLDIHRGFQQEGIQPAHPLSLVRLSAPVGGGMAAGRPAGATPPGHRFIEDFEHWLQMKTDGLFLHGGLGVSYSVPYAGSIRSLHLDEAPKVNY